MILISHITVMAIHSLKLANIIVLTLAVTACSYHRPIALNPQLKQKPLFQPLPLAIGVYKSPEFISRVEERTPGVMVTDPEYIISYAYVDNPLTPTPVFPLGKSSSTLLDQVLGLMFSKIVPVSSTDSKLIASQQKLAGMIEINIEDFSCLVCSEVTQWMLATITYRIKLNDASGKTISTWVVTGKGTRKLACHDRLFCGLHEIIEFAMLDAMSQFMVEFYDKPEVTSWLYSLGIDTDNH